MACTIITPDLQTWLWKTLCIILSHFFGQDFALDPEENRMCIAARNMVRFMTAGLALVSVRDSMLVYIANMIKNSFTSTLGVSKSYEKQIYQCVQGKWMFLKPASIDPKQFYQNVQGK